MSKSRIMKSSGTGEHVPGTRSQIEEPEVLVGDFTTQNHECLCAMKKGNASRATRQQHPRQWIGPAIAGLPTGVLHNECN